MRATFGMRPDSSFPLLYHVERIALVNTVLINLIDRNRSWSNSESSNQKIMTLLMVLFLLADAVGDLRESCVG